MNMKSDGPDKSSSQRPADQPAGSSAAAGAASKKPYATLDLKAVEVKAAEDAKSEAGKTASPQADAGKSAAPQAAAGKPDASKPADKPSPILTGAQPPASGQGKPGEAKPAAKDMKLDAAKSDGAKAASPAGRIEAERVEKRSGGVGSFFTHLAAGIVGGFLALMGADTIGQKLLPELGLPAPSAALTETTQQLQKRVASLEAQAQKPATPGDASAKLAAAETRIAKLEDARGEAIKLATEARSLAVAAGKQGAPEADQRLGKLEEKLSTLVAAAGTEPEKASRIPALALVTGKISDLEATMSNQLAALRKSVGEQIDTRVAAVSEASEAARNGTQRLDRDVATLKTDTARLKSDTDRMAVGLKTAQDDIAAAKSAVDTLKSDVDQRLKTAAKPADVSAAVAPVAAKLSSLEGSVENVVKSEESRKANAERIVLSLELGNLKRVLDRGAPFAAELAEVKKAAGGRIDFGALDRYKDNGVATVADLTRDFRGVANAVLDADAEQAAGGSVVDRLLAGAKSVVRVRKVGTEQNATGTEATLARMESALKDGRLAAVVEEAGKLPPKAAAPAQEWLGKVEARANVDRAISAVEANLKASLAAAPAATDTVKK